MAITCPLSGPCSLTSVTICCWPGSVTAPAPRDHDWDQQHAAVNSEQREQPSSHWSFDTGHKTLQIRRGDSQRKQLINKPDSNSYFKSFWPAVRRSAKRVGGRIPQIPIERHKNVYPFGIKLETKYTRKKSFSYRCEIIWSFIFLNFYFCSLL